MKALKLKSQTRYNYYLEWQKGGGITPSLSPPGEAIGGIDETKPVKKAPVQQSQEPENPNKEKVEEAIIPEEEIDMVATRGFFSNEDRVFWKRREGIDKFSKTVDIHREGEFKEGFILGVNRSRRFKWHIP